MAKTLREIFEVAGRAYPDHFVQRQFEQADQALEELSITEALASYIAKELEELYDPNSSDEANLQRITGSLERSAHLLEKVVGELRSLTS